MAVKDNLSQSDLCVRSSGVTGPLSSAMASQHREAFQKQIQQDWANREYIEVITGSIKKITDFLNSFGTKFSIFLLEIGYCSEPNLTLLVAPMSKF